MLFNRPAQAWIHRASCPGLCLDDFFNTSEDRDSMTSLKQPVPVLGHPHSEKAFPDVQTGVSCVSVCAHLPLVLSLGTAEKSLALSSLHPLYRWLYTLNRSPAPSLLQAEQSQLSHPFLTAVTLQSLLHLGGPSLDFVQSLHVSPALRSPELDPGLQMRPHEH